LKCLNKTSRENGPQSHLHLPATVFFFFGSGGQRCNKAILVYRVASGSCVQMFLLFIAHLQCAFGLSCET